MRNNPDDLANQLIQKVKDYIEEELDATVLDEDTMESAEHGVLVGRKEFAEGLLSQMEKWETEEEQGTVYTGDAPSTEASFYKKDKVNSATVIDLVVDTLTEAKMYIPLSPQSAMKAYDKITEAIQELKDHLTTVQTEDLDNQSYSEGERYDGE